MTNHSWLRPGVRAVFINKVGCQYPEFSGRIITVTTYPLDIGGYCFVEFEEEAEFRKEVGGRSKLIINVLNLKPIDDDNDEKDIPNWQDIAKGKDQTLPDYTPPVTIEESAV
jgi:hypothetical protein